MDRERYIALTLENLRRHIETHPLAGPEDKVKFIFQALLGVGHLLGDKRGMIRYIENELSEQSVTVNEPLCELVGPGWMRLNLRTAAEEGLKPETIANIMLASKPLMKFSREDVAAVCGELPEGLPASALERITDENWLPSHSQVYREAYKPCYRLVSADLEKLMPAIRAISNKTAASKRVLVTLDGGCASGKTTLAEKLADVFDAPVLHTDHFVVPHAFKTAGRLAIPGGNCDHERLVSEALAPWKSGLTAHYRKYDWNKDGLLNPETLGNDGVVILEGSYCNLPDIRELADVRLFMGTSLKVRMERLARRESPKSLKRFYEMWIPLEDAYFEAYRLPDDGCIII